MLKLALVAMMMMMASVSADDKVTVRFYGEAFWPYCKTAADYFEKHLLNLDGITDVIDFQYVPYGNAQGVPPATVTCQHGPEECKGNAAEACGVNQTGYDFIKYMPFVQCIDTKGQAAFAITDDTVSDCAKQAGLDGADILDCYKGPRGDKLIAQAAKDTPDHGYVPYTTVNGQELPGGDYTKVVAQVCKEYTGAAPSWCSKMQNVCWNN